MPTIEPNLMSENDLNTASLALDSRHHESTPKVDVLSQVLALVRLKGETIFTNALDSTAVHVVEGASRFYFVESGKLLVKIEGSSEPALDVEEGDLVLLAHGHAHTIHNATFAGTEDRMSKMDEARARQVAEADRETRYIGGLFRFDGGKLPPILAALPSLIHVPAGPSGTPAWLQAISHFLLHESGQTQPGAELMVSRLIDLLVIRALRTWSATAPGRLGFITGLSDTRIAQALAAIHAAPYKAWTVSELAAIATMSRSSFADRFSATVGQAPLHYLTRWRLHLAAEMLSGGSMRVSDVAHRVGYASDAAFSRAYKSCFGHSPRDASPRG